MASQKATGNQLISGEISVNTILDLHVNERKKKRMGYHVMLRRVTVQTMYIGIPEAVNILIFHIEHIAQAQISTDTCQMHIKVQCKRQKT